MKLREFIEYKRHHLESMKNSKRVTQESTDREREYIDEFERDWAAIDVDNKSEGNRDLWVVAYVFYVGMKESKCSK